MSIPIPQGMDLATVTWRLGHTTQTERLTGARGFVRFEPTAHAVAYPDVTVLPRPVEAKVTGGVMAPTELTMNDPELWNWRVVPEVGVPWTPFPIDVLADVDLASVAVVPGKGPIRAVTGPPGAGIAFHGEKPSVADLPADATTGDGWIVAGDLHVWSGHRWVNAGPIRGPQGVGIASISDPDTSSRVTVTYTDGTTSTVQAIRGADGDTPVIGWDGTALVIDGETGPDLKGEPGADSTAPGPPGPANSLTVGSVQTGETANASITGDAPSQELHLTIPTAGHVPEYDSGVRQIDSFISDGWRSATDGARILRQGNEVTLYVDLYRVGDLALSFDAVIEIPIGFRPMGVGYQSPGKVTSGPTGWWEMSQNYLRFRDIAAPSDAGAPYIADGDRIRNTVKWTTLDETPATPPGSST